MKTFEERSKELRIGRGPSLRGPADKPGMSYSTIGMYEQNIRRPDFDVLKTIADFFDVDTGHLLDRRGTKNEETDRPDKDIDHSCVDNVADN